MVRRYKLIGVLFAVMTMYLMTNMVYYFINSNFSLSTHKMFTHQISRGQLETLSEVKIRCTFPDNDPFHPSIMTVTKYNAPLTCEGGIPHLVYVSDDVIYVNHTRTSLVGDKHNTFKECRYISGVKKPGTDFKIAVVYVSDPFNVSITLRNNDDNLVVECYGSNSTLLSMSYFSLVRVKKDLELVLETNYKNHVTKYAPKEVLNVLMIGIDGNSKQNFQRHMPKTRNFLLNDLNAIELHKYNKIGENTYPNMIPMLTGKSAEELKRSNWTHKQFFDYVNDEFIWSDFHKAGYRTAISLDQLRLTAFHYCKKGWDKQPVDYYHRTILLLRRSRNRMMEAVNKLCSGDVPDLKLVLDFWIQMTTMFNNSNTRPYYGFSFFTRTTHNDHNMASSADHIYHSFLQEMKYKNIINNTVIIFFSDHGQRFGESRTLYQGMIESRTPYVFFVFPPWFHRKYPHLIKVLKINQDRLTTNRDVYETLRDLVNFQGTTRLGDINKRGISLFQEIPPERMCEHADIGVEYCLCNPVTHSNISSYMTLFLADNVWRKLLIKTSGSRKKCALLKIKEVKRVLEIYSDRTTANKEINPSKLYQITIVTKPGNAIYEATVQVFTLTKKASVVGDISRLDMYRDQAQCMSDTRLRPFCFCY